MSQENNFNELARRYHEALPKRIRDYLREQRGIAEPVIDRFLLGWDGRRITIPIPDREGRVAFFKLAKDPEDQSESPKMFCSRGGRVELYGWERTLERPQQIIVCEGEFDRLVLEGRGIAAVTSTGGAATFRWEWAEALHEISQVFVCFDNDEPGCKGAERVARLIPHARIVRLPEDIGPGGDVTDFFVRLKKSREDFVRLLEDSKPLPPSEPTRIARNHKPDLMSREEVETLKSLVRLEDVVVRYLPLTQSGQNYRARCPFHKDYNPSFVVFPATQTFHCFGCLVRGDVLTFLMSVENLSFPQALSVLRQIGGWHG